MFFLNILIQIIVAFFASGLYTGLQTLVVIIIVNHKDEKIADKLGDIFIYNVIGNAIMIFLYLFFTKVWFL